MRKVLLLAVLFLTLSIALNPLSTNAAIADGIHNVSFQVNKPDSNSASMANDYFLKPAKLIVSNGSMKVQITIKNSSWVTEFKPPGGATVISSNADQRVVQFNVSNLNTIKVAMKIDINEIDYHHSYTVDFVFNSNGLPEKQATEEKPSSSSNAAGGIIQNSSGSNGSTSSESATSSHSQAISKKPSSQSNQSSQDSNNQSSETDTLEEDTLNKEQNKSEVTGDISEVVENPETSDAFPYIYVLLLFGSIMLLVKFKNTQKN